MCSKKIIINPKFEYLHYGPGYIILAYTLDGCPLKYSIHSIDLVSVYIKVFMILY